MKNASKLLTLMAAFALAWECHDVRGQELSHPIVFVTQTPIAADFTSIGSTFGNHRSDVNLVPRGGDLWIRYPDGVLKNLTKAAGFGEEGFQGDDAIAVRDPDVHWDGQKVLFSMLVGASPERWDWGEFYWQLYEVSGLGVEDTPVITKVPNQPVNYNNVSPIYASDDQIIFTTDRPRNGARHLYPQLDEYEEAPTVSGLWKLDPNDGSLNLLDHVPSGAFTPQIDSYGRVIYTRWDHLERDQQADGDAVDGLTYGTFNFTNEAADAEALFGIRDEVFPEPRSDRSDLLEGTNLAGHDFNFFFPWMVNQDGTEVETLNHIGRHELHRYFDRALNDDPQLVEFIDVTSGRENKNSILNTFHLREDPVNPGLFYGVDAPEFQTHSAGMIFTLDGAPETSADRMQVTHITHPDTSNVADENASAHTGLYRNPLPTSDGVVLVVHTAEVRADKNDGTRQAPSTRYDFRIKRLVRSGDYWEAGDPLTSGIEEELSWWDPDEPVNYDGRLWELSPVELRARPRPASRSVPLEEPERLAMAEAGVELESLKAFLRSERLALVVSRNVTTRDDADTQQPFHLKVAGEAGVASVPTQDGRLYEVSHMQFMQGDQIRGIGLYEEGGEPEPGRRVIAQVLHDEPATRYLPEEAFPGSVKLGSDGSMAAVVPAERALSWQMLSPTGEPVVRERYWLTFQAGEIRSCTSCHGLNEKDHLGATKPTNTPRALTELLTLLKPQLSPKVGQGTTPRLKGRIVSPGMMELSWDATGGTFALESSGLLVPPSWSPVNAPVQRRGDEWFVEILTTGEKNFFRLR